MSKLRSLFGGTRSYAWFILLAGVAVFAVSFWLRSSRMPKPTELESLIAQDAPEEHVHAVAASPGGATYVGTHLGLVLGQNRSNWSRHPGITGDTLAVQVAADGTVFTGGEYGVARLAGDRAEVVLKGHVQALVADPKDAGHLIAFVRGAGLHESRDGGRSWARLSELGDFDLLALAIDPHNPGRIVAAGGFSGQLIVSEDSGRSWANASAFTVTVTSLLFDPATPGRLWGAVGGLVRHSEDGGATWKAAIQPAGDRQVVSLAPLGEAKNPVLGITSDGFLFTQTPPK